MKDVSEFLVGDESEPGVEFKVAFEGEDFDLGVDGSALAKSASCELVDANCSFAPVKEAEDP